MEMEDSNNNLVLLSKVLGGIVVAASATVKVPEIMNIWKYKSAKGMSSSSLYSQCLALSCGSAYNLLNSNPLMAWGENVLVLLQNFVVLGLIWKFNEVEFGAIASVVSAYLAMVLSMLSLRSDLFWMLPITATCVGISGQIPQIYENYKNGHTGPLSIVTQTMNVLGVMVRVFTTIQLTNDVLILGGFCVSLLFHLTLWGQIMWTRENTRLAMEKVSVKKVK